MPCETCGHTMQRLGGQENLRQFWCQRCGTLKTEYPERHVTEAPRLVQRCRNFGGAVLNDKMQVEWSRFGIAESISNPLDDPALADVAATPGGVDLNRREGASDVADHRD